MRLSSSSFADSAKIPRRFTCEGEDLSPPFDWTNAPKEARSFAIFCDDPDAPAGFWHLWAAYDMAADRAGLAEGAASQAGKEGFKQAINDFGRTGYGGPCPPHRHGPHHYQFPAARSVGRSPAAAR
ncbi:YbhB/YbcL family Raf kinase inhibitor-like protein [Mesorhizobium sp. CC13]|uniref:YbhB/YbcL family Raf kinase inhibitor-like protein n=1 Tax=Mesorhizobium sp. CC13 TaxID=3029194 RepID=UPI00326528AE